MVCDPVCRSCGWWRLVRRWSLRGGAVACLATGTVAVAVLGVTLCESLR